MPNEKLTVEDLRVHVNGLFQLLNDGNENTIQHNLMVASRMDALTTLWGDLYTPPAAPSPAALTPGQFVPGSPDREYQVMRIGSETVLINDEETVVMSATDAGKRYKVTLPHCECDGFFFRGKCRHVGVALEARIQYRSEHPNPTKGGLH